MTPSGRFDPFPTPPWNYAISALRTAGADVKLPFAISADRQRRDLGALFDHRLQCAHWRLGVLLGHLGSRRGFRSAWRSRIALYRAEPRTNGLRAKSGREEFAGSVTARAAGSPCPGAFDACVRRLPPRCAEARRGRWKGGGAQALLDEPRHLRERRRLGPEQNPAVAVDSPSAGARAPFSCRASCDRRRRASRARRSSQRGMMVVA